MILCTSVWAMLLVSTCESVGCAVSFLTAVRQTPLTAVYKNSERGVLRLGLNELGMNVRMLCVFGVSCVQKIRFFHDGGRPGGCEVQRAVRARRI